MAEQSEVVQEPFDFGHLVPEVWEDGEGKGLRKEKISYVFISMDKATEISKCRVLFSDISDLGGRESNYLSISDEQLISLSTSTTAIDCYIELFLMQMFSGEKSRCFIQTANDGPELSFTIEMLEVQFTKYLFEMTPLEMFEWATLCKNNGVKMYKQYPRFAQFYFSQACKGLISIRPFDELKPEEGTDAVALQALFDNVYINLAACLVQESRWEDILELLKEITGRPHVVSEKAIYRRALAHFHMKQYDEAKEQLERVNYRENKEFLKLYNNVCAEWKKYQDCYANMVKKMFG